MSFVVKVNERRKRDGWAAQNTARAVGGDKCLQNGGWGYRAGEVSSSYIRLYRYAEVSSDIWTITFRALESYYCFKWDKGEGNIRWLQTLWQGCTLLSCKRHNIFRCGHSGKCDKHWEIKSCRCNVKEQFRNDSDYNRCRTWLYYGQPGFKKFKIYYWRNRYCEHGYSWKKTCWYGLWETDTGWKAGRFFCSWRYNRYISNNYGLSCPYRIFW